jgi:hypothetical protein
VNIIMSVITSFVPVEMSEGARIAIGFGAESPPDPNAFFHHYVSKDGNGRTLNCTEWVASNDPDHCAGEYRRFLFLDSAAG